MTGFRSCAAASITMAPRLWSLIVGIVATLALAGSLRAQDEDDEEPTIPGLLTEFSAEGTTVERFDPGLNYDWGKAAPDPRLPKGPFLASWQGMLVTKQTTKYRFHAWLHGDVTIVLEGRTVLAAERKTPGWVSGEVHDLKSGEHELDVSFRSRPEGGVMRIFWSADTFAIEPIPEHMLFRDGARPDLDVAERGRREFTGHRCNRCHARKSENPSPPAPDLTPVAGTLDPAWIAAKLERGSPDGGPANMPVFGFDRAEAEAITAYLLSVARPPKIDDLPTLKPADANSAVTAGESLFRTVGCAGCHWPKIPAPASTPAPKPTRPATDRFELQPHAGGELGRVGGKRTREWLFTWLGQPDRLNADHRMPLFKLSELERAQLATALAGWKPDAKDAAPLQPIADETLRDAQVIARGKELVKSARCAACHRIPGIDPPAPLTDLSDYASDWKNACTQPTPNRIGWRPGYTNLFEDATKVFVTQRATATQPASPDLAGRELLERNNCLGCHDRGTQKGLSKWAAELIRGNEALRGQSEGLIPPTLTAMGDKLRDAALAEGVSGEQPKPRMPWLKVRMPKFRHTPEDKAALVAYLKAADRIPEAAPGATPIVPVTEPLSAEKLLLGQQLVGPTGFSCIACHEIGPYKPKNVALGTRGSDLMAMAGRLRPEFYLRWSRSPARIVPGMEMPSYQKPVAGILNENINAQLLAIWDAVNDPRFTPPTNPTAVEQLLTVAENAPARIVRDVFATPREFGTAYVPRSFAIGFNNGHSILLDLDTFTLRQWTFGDFARQRTEGKSWYWDLAGTPIVGAAAPGSDLALQRKGSTGHETLWRPFPPDAGRLIEYRPADQGMELTYDVRFRAPRSEETQTVRIQERIKPFSGLAGAPSTTGFTRTLDIIDLPQGDQLLVATHQSEGALARGRIDHTAITQGTEAEWMILPVDKEPLKNGVKRLAILVGHGAGPDRPTLTLQYAIDLTLRRIAPPERPVLMASPEPITTVPGFEGRRLPIATSIMPTSLTWTKSGTLAFSSLKGHVILLRDTDGDGLEETPTIFDEGLAAPYGLIADGDDLLVAHKPEVLRLRDTDGDGRADRRTLFASGWGYSDNYHDWTCGFARDRDGNLFVGLGSDYAQPDRKKETALWRGKVLKISPQGDVTPVASGFRYPTGLALDNAGRLFATDNQGVQNTFNELNHIVPGASYGVPSRFDERPDAEETKPAIQIPHPWTRSVNGITFLPPAPTDAKLPADHPRVLYAGHGIGCEYDTRFLVRFTIDQVGDTVQGATYPFSLPEQGAGRNNFTGPLSIGVSPAGDIYVGSIHDSGWLGGLNTGDITRLRANGKLPNGIVEMKAIPKGFRLTFVRPIDPIRAADAANYTLAGYTRHWKGAYATPDSGRHTVLLESATVSNDGRQVTLLTDELREGHVYELNLGPIAGDNTTLFPASAHYNLHRKPTK
ncbi:MAG: PQQ-dependent sugar dehydrogenase [Planctomycetaceae bacterium]|nr:PQQ-dependent sugar dehydrogenase [Planctomycetaceae bacterium]